MLTLTQQFPWLADAVAAQQRGFPEGERQTLSSDTSVYERTIDGVSILFRSGAIVIPSSERGLIESLLLRAHCRVTAHPGARATAQYLSYV